MEKSPRTSYDFEDIIYVLDNRTTLIEDILESEDDVKMFLLAEFNDCTNVLIERTTPPGIKSILSKML